MERNLHGGGEGWSNIKKISIHGYRKLRLTQKKKKFKDKKFFLNKEELSLFWKNLMQNEQHWHILEKLKWKKKIIF